MGDGRGPRLALLELTELERQTLQGLARRAKTAQALALRARIVLACADGLSNSEVSRQLGVSLPTVGKWRKRFVAERVEGLHDEPRPGAPRKITDAQIEAVIVTTLEHVPANKDSHWSTRSMAKAVGLNQTAVSRIWRAFGLKPHLVDTWKLSTDPLFIDKVRGIVGLYLDPPQGAMVLAVDEKSQIQAFHPDLLVVAEHRRTVVRRADQPQAAPIRPSQRHRPGSRCERLDPGMERRPETLCVDQDRRRDPRNTRRLLSTNQRLTTLDQL